MKKLQVMIDDELMKQAKIHALQADSSLKDIVTLALEKYLYTTTTESIKVSNDTSNTSNTSIIESKDVPTTTTESIIPLEKSKNHSNSSNTKIKVLEESNDTKPLPATNPNKFPDDYVPEPSGVDWDKVAREAEAWAQFGGQNPDDFTAETRYDPDSGEPYTIIVPKPHLIYGEVKKIENPPLDLDDPIERAIYEMEQKYK